MAPRDHLTDALGDRPEFTVTLELAVPMWAHKWAGRPPDQLVARARSLAGVVAAHGDAILYRSKGHAPRHHPDGNGGTITMARVPSSGEAFNALAEGVALLSLLSPAGVELFGRHFHDGWVGTDRDYCPRPQCL